MYGRAVLRFLLLTAIALVFAGCGTTTKTKTVTVTRVSTVEIEVPPEPAVEAIPAVTDEDYCGSAAGDALAQADSEASDAFNDADPAAFKRALEKAMRAVRKAPDGSECAAQALNSIAFSANNGAGNLDGLDLTGIVKRIRRFQKVHDLPRRNQ
jgi:ABC-type Fe3+-hydroxamate transport system substrate-binding protein